MRLPVKLLRSLRECFASLRYRLFSRENTLALLLCLIVLALAVMTAGRAPLWIYQGF